MRVAGPRRGVASISGDDRWPPKLAPSLDLRALAGFRLAPVDEPEGKMGAALLFALRAARPGRYTTRGVKLEYTVGDRRYTHLVPTALAVCVAPVDGPLPRSCSLPPIVTEGKVVPRQTVTVEP